MANFLSKTRKKLIIKELDPDTDLLKIFHYTQDHSKNFFLDSADNNEKTGRYSFIGYDPFLTVMSKGSNILTQKRHSITKKTGNPFDELRHLLSSFHLENGFDLSRLRVALSDTLPTTYAISSKNFLILQSMTLNSRKCVSVFMTQLLVLIILRTDVFYYR